tara:strand:- start:277 stop:579 length:303 start_codon:yes stop_codon:yes gene_type:complete
LLGQISFQIGSDLLLSLDGSVDFLQLNSEIDVHSVHLFHVPDDISYQVAIAVDLLAVVVHLVMELDVLLVGLVVFFTRAVRVAAFSLVVVVGNDQDLLQV